MVRVVFMVVVFMFGASSAYARCYQFPQQNSPAQVGLVQLQGSGQAIRATQMCVNQANPKTNSGGYESLTFLDSHGLIMMVSVTALSGRCGATSDCRITLGGLKGHVLGRTLSDHEANSITVTLDLRYNILSDRIEGRLTDHKTNHIYPIQEIK